MSKKPERQYVTEPKSAEEMFTDREEPRAAFWEIYSKIQPGEYEIIHYYGIGGIGKTTLLKQIELEISKKFNNSRKMSIYYNFEKNQSKEDFLFILSRQIMRRSKEARFPVFDYAFEKWMSDAGKTKAEIDSYVATKENEILTLEGAIDQISGIASDFLPFVNVTAAAAKGIISLCGKEYQKLTLTNNENKGFIKEINQLKGDEVGKNLVKYFAHDAIRFFEKFTSPFVILLDGYEALVNTLRDGDERASLVDAWIHKEDGGLVRQLPNVCWVVAGREQLQWDKELLPDNQKHLMGQISDVDARGYFNQIGIWDDELIEGLYELTSGTPAYMNLCYHKYLQLLEKQKESGCQIRIDDFGKNTKELAERYLKGMSPVHQDTVRIMCCLPDIWDNEMFSWVARRANYQECLGREGNKIKELSLIEKVDNSFKVHETFRSAVTNEMDVNEREKLSEIVFQYLFAILEGECTVREKTVMIGSYVQSLDRIGQCVKWNDEKLSKLVDCVIALNKEGDYQTQLDIAKSICEYIKQKVNDEENVSYLKALYCLALSYRRRYAGNHIEPKEMQEMKEVSEKVYEARSHVLGEEHPDTLDSLDNLAKVYHVLEDYEKSRELSEKVYEARSRVLGEEHPDTLDSLATLAWSYTALEDYEKSRDLSEKAYEAQRRVLGEEHRATRFSLYILKESYYALGDYEKLKELYEKEYEARRRVLGEEHPDTLASLDSLMQIYNKLGIYELSKEEVFHSLEAELEVIGAMLTNQEAIEIASGIISKDDFYNRQLRMIFETIVELNQEGHADDFEMLQNRLDERNVLFCKEYLRKALVTTPISAHVGYYAQIVLEKAILRNI